MEKSLIFVLVATFLLASPASWYWPFGDGEKDPPRISELMAPATELIDEASDLASEGRVTEAVGKYRAALAELERIERENPERAESPEFATLKTKRAYIGAAVDSLLMNQARDNAKAVAVSDTTELERKLAAERGGVKLAPEAGDGARRADSAVGTEEVQPQTKKVLRRPARKAKKASARPLTKNETIMKAVAEKDFATADRLIGELLAEKPNSAAALNLRAAKETAEGKFKEAEKTLDQAIQSNPRDYYAYYNMAQLYLQVNPENTAGARRYYETARIYGCPEDLEMEAALK